MNNSPLGQYAPLIASFTAVLLIGAYVVALLFNSALNLDHETVNSLQDVALLAIGAVFGSAVGVNGWKQSVNALHTRLDILGVPPAGTSIDPAPQQPASDGNP